MRHGPELPYNLVAGATPYRDHWVIATAKIGGSNFTIEPARIVDSFDDISHQRPAYERLVVNAPIGLRDEVGDPPRTCDVAARELVGRRRALAIATPPPRSVLTNRVDYRDAHLSAVAQTMLPRIREVEGLVPSYRQRSVFAGHPELSFYVLNNDQPLRYSKHRDEGLDERRSLIVNKIPYAQTALDESDPEIPLAHLYDAMALLWTARRVFGRAAKRLPAEGEWDSEGLRAEWVF